ncbi:hypothetical protein H1S01_16745 [Heliobacterium chlorum]|uniref:Transposase IS4-like domain-containing protein n=1 Tax=Heliobacterium chlorum TaxID=2698 RepID=A0ABR7T812_HELCL|nr:transposase [Heliobacterium chlorum]MBC9786115.1 hypothetical protein [Heliobacterium chlorum]MBC9786118.1 hypothetical protein [Heliobacterium chlorum]
MNLIAFTSFLVSQMIGIRKSQVKTLAALAFALFHTDNISVAAMGKAIQNMVADKHNIKRVDRFLGNPRLNVLSMAGALLHMICSKLSLNSRLLVALDWTDLHDDRHQTLVLALIVGSRETPVLWRTAVKTDLKDKMTQMEMDLVKDFRTIVPDGYRVIILADRGFAKVELFKVIRSSHFDFVIRLPKNNAFIFSDTYCGALNKFAISYNS